MFSIQRILGRDERFFDLLEAGAGEARRSVRALIEVLNRSQDERVLDEFILRRKQHQEISENISALLCRTFVTPLEREDIEALSSALYKIPRTIEKFCERMMISNSALNGENFSRQTRLLEQTIEVVCQMVQGLRRHAKLEQIKELNDRLQYYEAEADRLILELLRDLYGGRHSPLQVVVLGALYELLEKVIDRCRDCGDIIFHVVLKHS